MDKRERERFWRWLIIVTAAGFAVRVAYVLLFRQDGPFTGDSIQYHLGANLLAEGKGFINPLALLTGYVVESADHPPLYLLWLTLPSLVGLDGLVTHMLWSCVLGTATVAVTGLVGREIAGWRTGLIAAVLAAIYPNIWSHDGILQSETMAILTVSLALLLAYRYWHRPRWAGLAWLGAVCGLAALARSELILLVPFVVVPLVLITRGIHPRQKVKWLAVAGSATAMVLAPWVGYNLTRFEHPVLLSTGFEVTLLTASCDTTYYGPLTGYWSVDCRVPTPLALDQSQRSIVFRDAAFDYISAHKSRVPVVVVARWGRITGLFRPSQQVRLESAIEGRESWVGWTSLAMFYPIAALSIAGGAVLRRRRVPVFPLAALPVIVLISITLTFATNRYRAIAEPALVMLAAVAIDAGVKRWLARRHESAHVSAAVAGARAHERALTGP